MSDVVVINKNTIQVVTVGMRGAPGGATAFTQLTDVPSSYFGQAGKFVRVKSDSSGLEFVSSTAAVAWGGITGTLSNQTDLQAALDAKVSVGAAAGGELAGTYPNPTILNSAVISKVLTGFSAGAGVVAATDSIIQAFQKVVGNISALVTGVSSVFGRTGAITAQSGDYTTALVPDSTNKRYVSDAQLVVIGNTSGVNTGDQTITLTGDVTGSGTGSLATTIAANAVSNAKLATVATSTFKGRTTSGTGNVEDLTVTQATAMLNVMVGDTGSGGLKGLVTAPASGDAAAGKFLKADGTWAVPPGGGGGSPGGSSGQIQYNNAGAFGGFTVGGDATLVASTGVLTIAAQAVTFAKMQNIATDRLLGRDTASTGSPEEISVSGGIEFTGSGGIQVSAFTGDATKTAGGTALTLTTVNSNVGGFGSASSVATFTVNAKGLITAAASTAISVTSGAVSDFTEAAQDSVGAMVDSTLVYVDATPLLTRAALTGDVTAAQGSNATTIATNAVTDAKFRQSAGLSVVGRSANTTGNIADITGVDGQVLRVSGTALGFGTIATAGIANAAVTYAKIQDISATSRFLGRITAGAGSVEELTGTQATSLLNVFGASVKGLVPAAAASPSSAKYLSEDGTFTTPAGASPLTTKGDVYTYSTVNARLAVGTDGQVLTADSTQATGLKWAAAGGGGSPGGSNKQIQFNNSSAFGGAAGFEYQSGASPNVLLQAQAASHVPLTLKGAASQTANLFEVQNSSATVRTSVSKDGQLVLDGDGGVITVAQLVKLSGTTYWKLGTTIENNASTLQLDSTNARINIGGGLVYYDVSSGVARIQTFNELRVLPGALGGSGTRTMSVIAQNAGQVPFAVQGAASQTANLEEWRNSAGTALSYIRADGSCKPASLADSSAANDSIYYSTTASKLVYKDSGGTVNALY